MDKAKWFVLGAFAGAAIMAAVDNLDAENRKEKDQEEHPSNESRVRYQGPYQGPRYDYNPRSPQDKKRRPWIVLSIDPRKKTDQPLVKLEWEKKTK